MGTRLRLLTGLAVGVVVFALAEPGRAAEILGKAETELRPCCGNPDPDARGVAERLKEQRRRWIADKFEAVVAIPLPSSGLGVTDQGRARAADVRVILSRAGTAYAECSLKLVDLTKTLTDTRWQGTAAPSGAVEAWAEYKVEVKRELRDGVPSRRPTFGTCDTDLVAEGTQLGLPDPREGDAATVILVIDPADRTKDLLFLRGLWPNSRK